MNSPFRNWYFGPSCEVRGAVMLFWVEKFSIFCLIDKVQILVS